MDQNSSLPPQQDVKPASSSHMVLITALIIIVLIIVGGVVWFMQMSPSPTQEENNNDSSYGLTPEEIAGLQVRMDEPATSLTQKELDALNKRSADENVLRVDPNDPGLNQRLP
jgi:hypothetical protein